MYDERVLNSFIANVNVVSVALWVPILSNVHPVSQVCSVTLRSVRWDFLLAYLWIGNLMRGMP